MLHRASIRRSILIVAAVVALAVPWLEALASANDARTRYPIVLVHGLGGFDSLGGIVSYWNGIDTSLRKAGATVHVANLSSFASSELRGEQLIADLETLKAEGGHDRFNLIGHSQGAPTIRYVAAVRPDLVASVTSVGGVNQGSPVADIIARKVLPGSVGEFFIARATGALGRLIELLSGDNDPQSATDALQALGSTGMDEFNARYPQGLPDTPCGAGQAMVNGIYYASLGGTRVLTNVLDPSDVLLGVTSLAFHGQPNDGLVGRCASHLGDVIRDDYPLNHLDLVNFQPGWPNPFSPNVPGVYREHAIRLKNRDL